MKNYIKTLKTFFENKNLCPLSTMFLANGANETISDEDLNHILAWNPEIVVIPYGLWKWFSGNKRVVVGCDSEELADYTNNLCGFVDKKVFFCVGEHIDDKTIFFVNNKAVYSIYVASHTYVSGLGQHTYSYEVCKAFSKIKYFIDKVTDDDLILSDGKETLRIDSNDLSYLRQYLFTDPLYKLVEQAELSVNNKPIGDDSTIPFGNRLPQINCHK